MAYARDPLIYTWLFLSGATLLSWWLGRHANVWITLAILVIAVIKCRFVIRNYMEVHSAPPWLQRTCDAWLLVNLGMISSAYWFRF